MMTNPNTLPTYDELEILLAKTDAPINASEIHGMICGFICAGSVMDGRSWIDSIAGSSEEKDSGYQQCREMILEMYQASSRLLETMDFEFQLLLPDDDAGLPERARGLSHWCQGFLISLDMAGIDIKEGVSEDTKQVFEHFIEISKLDYDHIDVSEEDEKAYMEVMEYVRMAVLLVFSEIMLDREETQDKLH